MKMFGFALLAWPLGLMLGGCSKQGEDQAKARFQEYMTAWQERNFHRAWELMSPSLKSQNYSESQFTNFAKAQNVGPAGFTIQKIDVKGTVAIIAVDIAFRELTSNKMLGADRQACELSLHNGLWYFDSCKLPNSRRE